MSKHRACSKEDRSMNTPLYKEVYKTTWDDWYMELYENYPCENKAQLNKREGEVIRDIGSLNKRIAGRTDKQYRSDNADKIKEYKKIYRHENSEKIKEKLKEHYHNNIEKYREKGREYYQANTKKISEYRQEKITCECGAVICRIGKARHERSNKHINYINSLN